MQSAIVLCKNASGGNILRRQVVILDSTDADAEDMTTTNVAGDARVLGVLVGANLGTSLLANAAWGEVQTRGYRMVEYDGAVNLAVGDELSASATPGKCKKAAAGEMVFARTLDTNASTAVNIDVLLIERYVKP